MNWKIKTSLLILLLLPSFIGYPVLYFNSHRIFGWSAQLAVNGPTDGQVLYMVIVLVFIRILNNGRTLAIGITAAALVSLSIVFAGGAVAYFKTKIGLSQSPTEYQYSPYYIARYINILSVVPVSIAIFLCIPFITFEKSILLSNEGVTLQKKALLMIVRVVNHIRYTVIPDTLLVITEEKCAAGNTSQLNLYIEEAAHGEFKQGLKKILIKLEAYFYVFASVIASSIENIPFWAVEISNLPDKN